MDKIFGDSAGVFYDRNNSAIIKHFMKRSGMSTELMAKYLGVTTQYFNNKLSRNSFSIEDLMVASCACKVDLSVIDPQEYISNISDVSARVDAVRMNEKELVKAWYYSTKKELELMNEVFGFEEKSDENQVSQL